MDAIEILRGTEPHPESPLPWEAYAGHTAPCFRARDAQYVGECRHTAAADAAHIVAAVNAAPVLLAEIDRLRAQLAAAREAVAGLRSGLLSVEEASRAFGLEAPQ